VRYELLHDACSMTIEARSSIHPIRVETPQVTGHLDADVEDGEVVVRAGARLEVVMDGLRSGNPLIDRETRRRMDLRRHPRLVAELSDARALGDGVLACRGQVTFQERTRPVTGELEVRAEEDGDLRIEGRQDVDVRRWGLEPPRLLVLKVDPEVTVHLRLRARAADAST
jgi:polyisoprenoid-binding protein YceI